MKIKLAQWNQQNYHPPLDIRTVRKWAANGDIQPPAQKIGNAYYVDENAEYCPQDRTPDADAVEKLAAMGLDENKIAGMLA